MNIDVNQDQVDRWHNGELLQNVAPNVSPDEREFMISGMTGEEYDEMFKEPK